MSGFLITFNTKYWKMSTSSTSLLLLIFWLTLHLGLTWPGIAFDTNSHTVLINRLNTWAGISGNALEWFVPYLSNIRLSVSVGTSTTSFAPLGVAAGDQSLSYLFHEQTPFGPVNLALWLYVPKLLCRLHPAIYISKEKTDDFRNIGTLHNCLAALKGWMGLKLLQLVSDEKRV